MSYSKPTQLTNRSLPLAYNPESDGYHFVSHHASTHTILRHAGSTKIKQSLGGKEHRQENRKRGFMSWVTQTSPYHSQSIYPTPNKIRCNCPQCIHRQETKMDMGEANLWRKAPANHQHAGGSGFPEPAGTSVGAPSVVPTSEILAPSVVLSINCSAPSVVLTKSLNIG